MLVFNDLRLNRELCDAVIRVDGVEFHVHKIILCNCSPYFRSLFTQWSTPDRRDYNIPNVSPDNMKLIVEFAYTDVVPVTPDNVRELFIAADYFDVRGITQACCCLLEEQLVPQNCIDIWSLADFHYNPELMHRAFLFMLDHFEEVAATSEEFLRLSVHKLVVIIEDDRLNVRQEKVVFEAILRWIAYATEERREHIALLLSNVRLALTSSEYIADTVRNNELVRASEECLPILHRMTEAMHDFQTQRFSDCILHDPSARPRLPPSILLAVGGWSGNGPTNRIGAYDVRADRWVNVTDNEGPPLSYHGTVFLDGSLYCVGGFDGVEQLSTVQMFDLDLHIWQEVSQMHSRRCYVSVTAMDGCIYAMGGYNGHNRLSSAERYQPEFNQWTLIAPMHEQRSDANCTALHGKVYICGGFNGTDCLSTAECYDPQTDRWTLIASMDNMRSGIGVVAYADHVFAVGGFNGTVRLDTAEVYNPYTNTWQTVPSMRTTRSNFGIAVIEDHLFVVGGFNGLTIICEVERYDMESGQWTDVSDMQISRSALSCCVLYGLSNLAEYAAPHHSLPFTDMEEDDVE